jgi:hypothetical protein
VGPRTGLDAAEATLVAQPVVSHYTDYAVLTIQYVVNVLAQAVVSRFDCCWRIALLTALRIRDLYRQA